MDDPTLQEFDRYYRDLPDARVEAEIERWLPSSRQRDILVGILAERRGAAQQAEADRFRQTYEQTERHHATQVAESRRQSRRAEIVAWAALAFSITALLVQQCTPSPHESAPSSASPSATPIPSAAHDKA